MDFDAFFVTSLGGYSNGLYWHQLYRPPTLLAFTRLASNVFYCVDLHHVYGYADLYPTSNSPPLLLMVHCVHRARLGSVELALEHCR